jgi:hypothetical protein
MMNAKVKYPRTYHLPFSPGKTSDDKSLKNMNHLFGKEVIVTEKMDGENTSLYFDGFHARSLDSRHHPSRNWVKNFHSQIKHDIPHGWRICGENLYAQHSLAYDNLSSYFLGFSIWNENNVCLSWDDTLDFFRILEIEPVKTLYRGLYSDEVIQDIIKNLDLTTQEGFVVRLTNSFAFRDFSKSVAKWVRKNHVQTSEHWSNSEIIPNKLKKIS